MKKLSENSYFFISDINSNEIKARLHERILRKESLTMERTQKDFIGKLYENKFSLIDSWFPIGSACVIDGIINGDDSTQINLTTSLQKAFQILFLIWIIVITGLVILGSIKTSNQSFSIGPYFVLLIGIVFFRLFIHGIYVLARNSSINKLEWILELKQN